MAGFCRSCGDQHANRDDVWNPVPQRSSEFWLRHSLGSRVWVGLVVSWTTDFAPGAPWRAGDVDHEGGPPFLAFSGRSPVVWRRDCRCFSAPRTFPREMAPDGPATARARTQPTETFWHRRTRALAFRAGCRRVIADHARMSASASLRQTSSICLQARIPVVAELGPVIVGFVVSVGDERNAFNLLIPVLGRSM